MAGHPFPNRRLAPPLQHRLVEQRGHRSKRVVGRDRQVVNLAIKGDVGHAVDQPPEVVHTPAHLPMEPLDLLVREVRDLYGRKSW